MLKSFYKYLVDELITDYFTTHKPGSFGLKYFYVLFENAEHRNGLYNAIAENLTAHDITVTGIFENRQEWMDVDVLNTKCFQPNADGAEIIVGNESVIDNGYLTTLRNAVVQPDSQYSDKTLFCILCNNIQSPNQKIPDRKTKCVIKTHINIKQNVIFGAKLKPV